LGDGPAGPEDLGASSASTEDSSASLESSRTTTRSSSPPSLKSISLCSPGFRGRAAGLERSLIWGFASLPSTKSAAGESGEGKRNRFGGSRSATCCYALREKYWLTDPDGDSWEIYAILEDLEEVSGEPPVVCGAP